MDKSEITACQKSTIVSFENINLLLSEFKRGLKIENFILHVRELNSSKVASQSSLIEMADTNEIKMA